MPTLAMALDARGATLGAQKFDQATDRVKRSARGVDQSVARSNQGLDAFGRTATRTSSSVGRLTTMVGRLVGGFAALAVVAKTVRVLGEFEQTMATVQGVTGATEEQFAALTARAREMGATTRFSASEAGDGILFLARAGFSANQSISALPATLQLAQAGAIELGEAADIASNVLSQFALEAENMDRVAHTLIATSNRANTDVRQLAEAMKMAGPVAGALGIEVEETSAAIGVLGDSGIQASLAGTNLRGALAALLGPTEGAKNAIKSLGVSLEDVNPEKVGIVGAFQALSAAGMGAGEAVEIFGRRNAAAGIILSQNVDRVKQLNDEVSNTSDEHKRMADVMDQTLIGAFKSLNSAVEEVMLTTGDAGLIDVLERATRTMTDAVRIIGGVDGAFENASFAARRLAEAIEILAVSGAMWVSLRFGMMLAGAATAMWSLVRGTRALNFAMAKNPIGLLAVTASALIVELGFLDSLLKENDESTQSVTDSTWDYVEALEGLEGVLGAVADAQTSFNLAAAEGDFETQIRELDNLRRQLRDAREVVQRAIETRGEDSSVSFGEINQAIPHRLVGVDETDQLSGRLAEKASELFVNKLVQAAESQLAPRLDGGFGRGPGSQTLQRIGHERPAELQAQTQEMLSQLLSPESLGNALSDDQKRRFMGALYDNLLGDDAGLEMSGDRSVSDRFRALQETLTRDQLVKVLSQGASVELLNEQGVISATEAMDLLREADAALAGEQEHLRTEMELARKVTEDQRRTAQNLTGDIGDLVRAMKNEQDMLGMSADERRLENDVRKARSVAMDVETDQLNEVAATLRATGLVEKDSIETQKDLADALEHVMRRQFAKNEQIKDAATRQKEYNDKLKEQAELQREADERIAQAAGRVEESRFRLGLVGLPQEEQTRLKQQRDRLSEIRDFREQLKQAGVTGYNQEIEVSALRERLEEEDRINNLIRERQGLLQDEQRRLEKQQQDLERTANQIGDAFSSAFARIITGAEDAEQAVRELGAALLEIVIKRTITDQLGNAIAGTITEAFGPGNNAANAAAAAQANGNAFHGGSVIPFASGGVVGGPTMFPMRGGRTGLMGEEGPEAIMPLQRMPGGKLGVQANAAAPQVNVIIENHSKENARVEESSNASGGKDIRVMIGEAIAGDIQSRGPAGRAIEQTYGLQRGGVRR